MNQMITRLVKCVWNIGAGIFFVFIAFISISRILDYLHIETPSMCSNTDLAPIKSPDGKKSVTYGYIDCGATTNWQGGIVIRDVETNREYRGIFGILGKQENIKLTWSSNNTLVISNFPIKDLLWFNQSNAGGISVELEP